MIPTLDVADGLPWMKNTYEYHSTSPRRCYSPHDSRTWKDFWRRKVKVAPSNLKNFSAQHRLALRASFYAIATCGPSPQYRPCMNVYTGPILFKSWPPRSLWGFDRTFFVAEELCLGRALILAIHYLPPKSLLTHTCSCRKFCKAKGWLIAIYLVPSPAVELSAYMSEEEFTKCDYSHETRKWTEDPWTSAAAISELSG